MPGLEEIARKAQGRRGAVQLFSENAKEGMPEGQGRMGHIKT